MINNKERESTKVQGWEKIQGRKNIKV